MCASRCLIRFRSNTSSACLAGTGVIVVLSCVCAPAWCLFQLCPCLPTARHALVRACQPHMPGWPQGLRTRAAVLTAGCCTQGRVTLVSPSRLSDRAPDAGCLHHSLPITCGACAGIQDLYWCRSLAEPAALGVPFQCLMKRIAVAAVQRPVARNHIAVPHHLHACVDNRHERLHCGMPAAACPDSLTEMWVRFGPICIPFQPHRHDEA